MPIGPGKYDDACTEVREKTGADGIILIVIRGNQGDGFSAQASPEDTLRLPEMLRYMAQQIEESL